MCECHAEEIVETMLTKLNLEEVASFVVFFMEVRGFGKMPPADEWKPES